MKKMPEKTSQNSELILFQTEDGKTRLEVRFEGDTAWLSQSQMAELSRISSLSPNCTARITFRGVRSIA